MQVIGTPPVLAPQSTGHPLSLPEVPLKRLEPEKVNPATSGSNANGAHGRSNRPYSQPKTPNERPAPPSAMQIEIEMMLTEQAEKLEQENLEEDRILTDA